MQLNELVEKSHEQAKESGFWSMASNDYEWFPAKIALIHSELSEALEADREGNKEGVVEELADTVIRICDLCGWLGIDLELAIEHKMKINARRPRKHDKKY